MATLPARRAWVWVGPPLLASGPRFKAAEVTAVSPGQLPSVSRFAPLGVRVPALEQLPPLVLFATIEFLRLAVAPLKIPPPSEAEFDAIVTKLRLLVPRL
jgi:hypothetical protein